MRLFLVPLADCCTPGQFPGFRDGLQRSVELCVQTTILESLSPSAPRFKTLVAALCSVTRDGLIGVCSHIFQIT